MPPAPLGQMFIGIRQAKHPALGPRVLHLVCLGARLFSEITPMLRIGLARHLMPPSVAAFDALVDFLNQIAATCRCAQTRPGKTGLDDLPPTRLGLTDDRFSR